MAHPLNEPLAWPRRGCLRLQSASLAPLHIGSRPPVLHHALLPPHCDLSAARSFGRSQGKASVIVFSLGRVVGCDAGPNSRCLRALYLSASAGDANSIRTRNARTNMARMIGRARNFAFGARATARDDLLRLKPR